METVWSNKDTDKLCDITEQFNLITTELFDGQLEITTICIHIIHPTI